MWEERNNTKIMYRRATITVYICIVYTVTVALMHLYTILHPLMWVFFFFFLSKCVKYSTFCIYETPTSVHLLYTIFYINNIFMRERERERERERVRWRENVSGEK